MEISTNAPTVEIDQYNGRVTIFVILSCVVATIGGVIFGYDVGIIGDVTSSEEFLEKFFKPVLNGVKNETDRFEIHYSIYNSHQLAAFRSIVYIVGAFVALIAAPITQKYGQRSMMMIGGATSFVGSVVGGTASWMWTLILGRIFLGMGVGIICQAVPLYLSEMALPVHRGAFGVAFRFSQGVGFILANLINYVAKMIAGRHAWRLALAFVAAPASFLTLGAAFLPETPASLIRRGQLQSAIDTLQSARGTADIITELNDIVAASSSQENSSITFGRSYRRIGQRKYWPRLVMVIAIPLFSQVAASILVSYYDPFILKISKYITNPLTSTIVLGLVGLGANTAAAMIIDRVGRCKLMTIGGALMFSSQMISGGIMVGNLANGSLNVEMAMIYIFLVGLELSWGPASWFMTNEIFPQEIRSTAQSIAVTVSFLVDVVATHSLFKMHKAFGFNMYFFSMGWALMMTAFIWLLFPETKAMPMEHMGVLWREHWFWRRVATKNGREQD